MIKGIDRRETTGERSYSIEAHVDPHAGPRNTKILLTNRRLDAYEIPYNLGPDIDISFIPRDTPVEASLVAKSFSQETANLFVETYVSGVIPTGWYICRPDRHIVSRSIKLWHPDFPDNIFTLGGVGLGLLDEDRNSMTFSSPLTINDWDLSRLYAEIQAGLNRTLGITTVFNADGSTSQIPDSSPCGGYTYDAVRAKLDNTRLFNGYRFKGILFPEMLIFGKYTTLEWREEIHFLIYKSPIALHFKDMLTISGIVDATKPDFYPFPNFLPYLYAYKLSNALRNIMRAKYIHGQLHLGNHGHVANRDGAMLLSDLETVQSLAGLDNTGNHICQEGVGRTLQLTPCQFAIINELAKPLAMMLEETATHQDFSYNDRIWNLEEQKFSRFALNLCAAFVIGHREKSPIPTQPDKEALEFFRHGIQSEFLEYLGYNRFPMVLIEFIRSLASFTSYKITQEMYPNQRQRKENKRR